MSDDVDDDDDGAGDLEYGSGDEDDRRRGSDADDADADADDDGEGEAGTDSPRKDDPSDDPPGDAVSECTVIVLTRQGETELPVEVKGAEKREEDTAHHARAY